MNTQTEKSIGTKTHPLASVWRVVLIIVRSLLAKLSLLTRHLWQQRSEARRFFTPLFAILTIVVPAGIIPIMLRTYVGELRITQHPICLGVIPVIELYFIYMFVCSLIWALTLYIKARDDSSPRRTRTSTSPPRTVDANKLDERHGDDQDIAIYALSFYELADTHKLWSQVWFTISISIFLGGLTYAIFHVGQHVCVKPWLLQEPIHAIDGNNGNIIWSETLKQVFPNIFIYSLFFVAWHWSARHYRAHWHNYVLNAFRHRALNKIASLEERVDALSGSKRDDIVSDLRVLSALLLLLPTRSAYTETEDAGETGAERIVKIEEMLREIINKRR